LLIGLQEKPLGWATFGLGVVSLLLLERKQAKELLLPYLLLAILGSTPIGTELSNAHMATMGGSLIAAIAVPAVFDRKWLGSVSLVRFPWRMGRPWSARERGYVVLTIVLAYFVLPFYLRESGAYLNWGVDANAASVFRLFLGTNAVGLWDELAFIIITLSVLRRYLPFFWANLLQAILFTSFLYELGFTSWGALFIFPFALLQGLIFKNKESLSYVVTIHLSLDFVLFLAIVNAHHPEWFAIFVT
jgi:membrane protease YdiL (CAAX protease family)